MAKITETRNGPGPLASQLHTCRLHGSVYLAGGPGIARVLCGRGLDMTRFIEPVKVYTSSGVYCDIVASRHTEDGYILTDSAGWEICVDSVIRWE